MALILVLHGPNLNRLGSREPEQYGTQSLADIDSLLLSQGRSAGHNIQAFQSNSEGELINRVHLAADEGVDFMLINPAGFTHTSVALRDAILAANIDFIEVHLSNIFTREPFRHHSYFSDIAMGVISGFGPASYTLALDAAIEKLA